MPPPPHRMRLKRNTLAYTILAALLVAGGMGVLGWRLPITQLDENDRSPVVQETSGKANGAETTTFLQQLLELGIYNESDLVNEIGKTPPYWEDWVNPAYNDTSTWGPCYPEKHKVSWEQASQTKYFYRHKERPGPTTIDGGCRPGFLIIGAGKCGTSSLYQYLVHHPRVAPAVEKQIHYFKYNMEKPLAWYYAWFPTASTFLGNGALMTGEASPGYLPYPNVVKNVQKRLPGSPKILMVGRNPLDRMYSSYRYNYVAGAIEQMKRYGHGPAKARQDDDYYQPFLFSFEELIRAELQQLQDCLYGFGIKKTRNHWYAQAWTRTEFDRRDAEELEPLMDLDKFCYGDRVNKTVIRKQWAELQMNSPEKHIPVSTAFLVQAMIGRSLYVLPLEWWYIIFPPEDIFFVCTEELSNPDMLSELSLNMGLPSFDFTDVVAEGAYNVGGHKGYDKATTWQEVEKEHEQQVNETEGDRHDDGIPLSDELRQEVLGFIRPFNERLFSLVGKRCDW